MELRYTTEQDLWRRHSYPGLVLHQLDKEQPDLNDRESASSNGR